MKVLETTDEINRALADCDPKLGTLIARVGYIRIPLMDDYFSALLGSIIGQQLSGRAADAIWARLNARMDGDIRPEKILAAPEADLRGIGLSYAKARYAKALSDSVLEGALRLDALEAMDDDEAICELTAVKGVGKWTAEMFLIFSLGRPDVFSCGDAGLKRAMQKLYAVESDTESRMGIGGGWKPYRTYASLYLWQALDRKLI